MRMRTAVARYALIGCVWSHAHEGRNLRDRDREFEAVGCPATNLITTFGSTLSMYGMGEFLISETPQPTPQNMGGGAGFRCCLLIALTNRSSHGQASTVSTATT